MASKGQRYTHLEETRNKIKVTHIIKRMQDHIDHDGDLMTSSQVTAAKALLNKVLPDLKSTEIDHTTQGDKITGLTVSFKDVDDSQSD